MKKTLIAIGLTFSILVIIFALNFFLKTNLDNPDSSLPSHKNSMVPEPIADEILPEDLGEPDEYIEDSNDAPLDEAPLVAPDPINYFFIAEITSINGLSLEVNVLDEEESKVLKKLQVQLPEVFSSLPPDLKIGTFIGVETTSDFMKDNTVKADLIGLIPLVEVPESKPTIAPESLPIVDSNPD